MERSPSGPRPARPASPPKRSDGQATPLLAIALVLAVAAMVAVLSVGMIHADRASAAAAADASALAAALDGVSAARSVARANGARVVGVRPLGADVEVTVERRGVRATARARRIVEGGPSLTGLDARLVVALRRAERTLGSPVPITSGYRSPEQQRRLWERRHQHPYPVARPGTSAHERGLAVDVSSSFAPRLARVGRRVGLCRPLPRRDPIHFVLCDP